MPEQGADILAHFGEDHFLERYQRYKAHIAEWRQQYPKLAAVDLRYDQQVVLRDGLRRRTRSQPRRGHRRSARPQAGTRSLRMRRSTRNSADSGNSQALSQGARKTPCRQAGPRPKPAALQAKALAKSRSRSQNGNDCKDRPH